MPNWCENYIIITGHPKTLDWLDKTKFDFNKIRPMPQVFLDDISGKNLGGQISTKNWSWDIVISHDPKQYDLSRLEKHDQEIVESWIRLYGYPGWYEWSCASWGTKWNRSDPVNTCRVSPEKLFVRFSTAWGPPVELLGFLTRKHDVRLAVRCDVEGNDSYTFIVADGIVSPVHIVSQAENSTMYIGAPERNDEEVFAYDDFEQYVLINEKEFSEFNNMCRGMPV